LERPMNHPFRHNAGYGKRMEYWIIGRLLKEGHDVFVPLVDDEAIDAIIKKRNGSFIELQIKARSKDVIMSNAALFAAIPHPKKRSGYFFVFYSERLDKTWVMSSPEFLKESVENKTGRGKGLHSIWFNGTKMNKATGQKEEYVKDQWVKYLVENFSRFN
jgi:hypothetical protein